MDKKKMIQYIEIINKVEYSLRNNEKYKLTPEEETIVKEGNEFSATDEELRKIKIMPFEQRKKFVEKFYEEEQKKSKESEEEQIIKETYGFDITSIEHKLLNNGVEIFKFYAPKIGRTVILKNRKDKTLTEQLKEMQAQNKQFQSEDEKQNTNDMLEKERNKDNVELNMISVNEIGNYNQTLSNMKGEEKIKISYIITNARRLNVKSINLENQLYLDKEDNIREVILNKEENRIVDQNPKTLNYHENDINVSDKVDESLSIEGQAKALTNEYEDNPEELDEYEKLPQDIKNQILTYKDFPDQLLELDEEERKKWQHYIDLHDEHRKKRLGINNGKQKVKERDNISGHRNGFVNVVLLSIISLIVIAGVFLLVYQIYK